MNHLAVELVPMLSDNYAYLLTDRRTGAVGLVDPAEAWPAKERLAASGNRLDWIFITHHHRDHTGGVVELKRATGCRVAGPRAERDRLPPLDLELAEGDSVRLGETVAKVMETPGHTQGHIAYYFAGERALFCGDTLFALGCGRLIEGDAVTMWRSLEKLMALPDDVRVYCGHEYTAANARFARSVAPDDRELAERAAEVEALRRRGEPTIPSSLAREKRTNPFLKAGSAERFAELRRLKDRA